MRFDQFQLNFDLSQAAGLDRHRIVIAYDTPNNKRRRLFARTALSYARQANRGSIEAMRGA